MKNIKELIIKYKTFFVPFLAIILFISGSQIVLPKFFKIIEIYKIIKLDQNRLNNLRIKIADLQRINESKLSENNNLALKAIPSKKNMITVLSSLGTLANENAILIDEITISSGNQTATSSSEQLDTFTFSLKLIGDTNQIRNFAGKINTILPIFTLKDLSIDSLQGASILRIQSYYLGFPKKIAKVEEPLVNLSLAEQEILQKIATNSSLLDIVSEESTESGKTNPFSE